MRTSKQSPETPMQSNSNLEVKYQKKTEKEHVLDNPDTYIGSVQTIDTQDFLVDNQQIISKSFTYVPGLYKLFDEAIVNCRDHAIRMHILCNSQSNSDSSKNFPVTHIHVTCNKETGEITMMNDGNGIDVAEHPEHKIWIPEMIFGHMRTSTNYNKEEKRIVGGKNGFGFKLVLIWSSYGKVETVDHKRGLKYVQEFHNNLETIGKPKITKCKTKPYTKVTFIPDYHRLGMTSGLTTDIMSLFQKRTYDIAAVTEKTVKVHFNSVLVPVKTFQSYVDMYLKMHKSSKIEDDDKTSVVSDQSATNDNDKSKKIYEQANDRWEYAVSLSPTGEFASVSFVNGIYTSKGGKHVDYILNQIVRKIIAHIKAKKKIDVKPAAIKEQLMLFLRCDINNPSFDSQTKDYMNTPVSAFGSTCDVSDKFIEKVAKMGVITTACAITEIKDNKIAKKTDGEKSLRIRGIHKLVDANYAGTNKSNQCILLLCEGDSAKAGVISGLKKEDRDFIGVYPMKGKIFNVRGETIKKISENKEISEIKKIIGLETGRVYTQADTQTKLRYGKIVFMTDQDLDGSHIKGLGINLFHSQWHSLATIPGFISFMNTPILKARKNKEEKMFYNMGEFNNWYESLEEKEKQKWNIKYYKGLGTSTAKEFQEYFKHKHFVDFLYETKQSDDVIDMLFNKKRTHDRKTWLSTYDRDEYVNTSQAQINYSTFFDKEFKHFSKYDCDRSIPNMMDGLKPSLRKIVFSAFKKNLQKEIKVAQFSGYVSEVSGYHHGEASLNGAIVGMAQTFVGSNNINLLQPNGQFGTRLQGGHDSASERYIFTNLNPITSFIFRAEDNCILQFLDDDGQSIEPLYYLPIIPMVLVNGIKGIGTGFSTDILPYNVMQIIMYLENLIKSGNQHPEIEPYYEGFTGTITKFYNPQYDPANTNPKYLIRGKYELLSAGSSSMQKIHITELPIGVWTDDYKEFLESLIEKKKLVKDYVDSSTDTKVDIVIVLLNDASYSDLIKKTMPIGNHADGSVVVVNEFEKTLKLYSTQSTSNMHAFNHEENLKKYDSIQDIIEQYFHVRLDGYVKRREYMLEQLKHESEVKSNKARFILETIDDLIDLRKKKQQDVKMLLEERNYYKVNGEFKYLTQLPMDSVTVENSERLMKERDQKLLEYEELKKQTPESIWLYELQELKEQYASHTRERNVMQMGDYEESSAPKSKRKLKLSPKK